MKTIEILKVLQDNFAYMIQEDDSAIVVDPGEARPVLHYLQEQNLYLSAVLLTHHHADHTGGAAKLKKETGCSVIGPEQCRADETDRSGDVKKIGSVEIEVIATPGHTRSHVVYHVPQLKALFAGDTLFIAGCGRLFEGTAEQMLSSLQKLAALPDDTKVYCGHEYTEYNLKFAATVEPDNPAIMQKLNSIRSILASGGYSVPSTIAEEKTYNPFLRTHDLSIRKNLTMESASNADVFAELRRRKDIF